MTGVETGPCTALHPIFPQHWQSKVDCEMAEVLLERYATQIDWEYLERRVALPENDCQALLAEIRARIGR